LTIPNDLANAIFSGSPTIIFEAIHARTAAPIVITLGKRSTYFKMSELPHITIGTEINNPNTTSKRPMDVSISHVCMLKRRVNSLD